MLSTKIKSSELRGSKYLKNIIELLYPLRNVAIDPVHPNKRTLHMDEYISMFLMYMFSPICSSLRSLQRASELKGVCKKFGFKRTGLSTLSDAQHVFDASLLEEIIDDLGKQCYPSSNKNIQKNKPIVLVDGTVIPAVKEMLWATYRRQNDDKAIKCHFLYNLNNNVPLFTKVTSANTSETKVLEECLEPEKCYVMDRGYAKHALMQSIIDKHSSFVLRIQDDSVLNVLQEKELSHKALESGVVRDAIVKLGTTGNIKSDIRIVEVECIAHIKKAKNGRGGPEQGDTLLIATNEFDLPATMISAIYQSRWQIEIFFRHLKHLLGCQHLLCHSKNGVKVEMYVAIIACMLIMIWLNKKPTKATFEVLQYYMMGLADNDDLQSHIERLKATDASKKRIY